LVYADDVNLLGENKNVTKKNTKALLDANKDVDLKLNAEKIKYVFMSCLQNSGQNHNIKIANESFENGARYRYVVMTLN
jgi:hypothetical protein